MSLEPRLEHVYSAKVELGPPTQLGDTPKGYRLIVPINGGTLEGPGIKGRICPGGSDWIVIRPDGVSDLDIRVTVQTEDDALIYVTMRGYITRMMEVTQQIMQGERVPVEDYYFVMAPAYETSDERYGWLQQAIVVAQGEIVPGGVHYEAYAVR